MSGVSYSLAHIDGVPDVEFPSIRALAAYLVGHRDVQARGEDGQPPEIVLRAARMEGRQGLEGACIAVRLREGPADWADEAGARFPALVARGQLVGYAYLPDYRAAFITPQALGALMAAILVEADAAEARRATPKLEAA